MADSPEGALQKEISPVIPIVVAAIVLLVVIFFAFLKPKMDADRALRDFNTPEAQAKRDPDTRAFKPETQKLIEELKAKEQHMGSGRSGLRRAE